MKRVLRWGLVLGLAPAIALGGEEQTPREFDAVGTVREVQSTRHEVVIEHDAITGYMPAMTMPFAVRDAKLLEGLRAGDRLAFKLHVTATEGWVDGFRKLQRAGLAKAGPPAPAVASAALDVLRTGDPLPDAVLTDERGQPLRLADYRGEALAITFIFTRCPYPTFCPLISAQFAAVQKDLSSDPAAPKNWRLLSVTIDPEHDGPEALAAYAKAQHADPERWHFATGTLHDITVLALRCGVTFWEEGGTLTHNLRTLVVEPSGRVRRIFMANQWKVEDLEGELRAAAEVK